MKNGFIFWHKRLVGILVGVVFLMTVFAPPGGNAVYAFDPDNYRVDSLTVFKVYDSDRNAVSRRILISGAYLKDASVGIITGIGYEELSDRITNTEGMLQFNIGADQIGNQLVIEGFSIAINEESMPTLTSVNRKVVLGESDLVIDGTNLKQVNLNASISAGYEHEGAYNAFDTERFTDNQRVVIPTPSGSLGKQDIIFKKSNTVNYEFHAGVQTPVNIEIRYTYQDQFTLVQNLNIPDLNMYPNRGENGDTVFFEAAHPNLDAYDVFFVRKFDGTDPYTMTNRGQNKTFLSNVEGQDILTVHIPDLDIGEYFVILTNPIPEGEDPMESVQREMIVGTAPDYEKFTVVDASTKSQIFSVEPPSGSDTGSDTTISGQYLGTLNIPEYMPDNDTITVPAPVPNCMELVLEYAPGTYEEEVITSAIRKVRVLIGNRAVFTTIPDGSAYDLQFNTDKDVITVHTPSVADAHLNPVKDVVIETETILTRADGTSIEFTERAELTDGYTFIPSKVVPVIEKILPEKIQVAELDASYEIPEERVIAIYGTDFMVNRYSDSPGHEITHYPLVTIGDSFVLDPNNDAIEMKVFKEDGTEVDGTDGNELGTKILLTIPQGKVVPNIGPCDLKVTNPMRNSDITGLSATKYDFVEFVCSASTICPLINMVTPDILPVQGNVEVLIEGNNFRTNVRLFMDGHEIENFVRSTDGQSIRFAAPSSREAVVQLQVMNSGGGMDTWYLTYVTPYTEPAISSFAPESGNTGTLVQITGENFLKPDPTSPEDVVHKIIGTRVLLEGDDVNSYYRNPSNGRIETVYYTITTQDPILTLVDDENGRKVIELADYAYAVILELEGSDPSDFYRLEQKLNGDIKFTDGARDTYTLRVNDDGTGILAVDDTEGTSYVVTVHDDGISAAGTPTRTFKMKTLYSIDENNDIIGCRVRVVDANTIRFYVPILDTDGYYDLTIVNPDTKSDTIYNEQGFYYYKQPITKPRIDSIVPERGSVEGGYYITLNGAEFEDNGFAKTRVYINGTQIVSEDVEVNIDGTSVVVKIAPYPGDLREDMKIDQLSVPVVVVNPDGGTFSLEDGFTYVISSSQPNIGQIVPNSGSASGGETVELMGVDFRYFEPYDDENRNQVWDIDEPYTDINGNGRWDSEADLDDPLHDWTEPVAIEQGYYTKYYSSPILPRVVFNDKPALIVEFSSGYIKVLTPAGIPGNAEVVIINNDAGISNTVTYEYIGSNPQIASVIPDIGGKHGGELIEIHGSNLQSNIIEVYENGGWVSKNMPLFCFGDMNNNKLVPGDVNYGRVNNGRAAVVLDGLTVGYSSDGGLDLFLDDGDEQYWLQIPDYGGSVRYINMRELLTAGDEAAYSGWELLRVEIVGQRLLVERGYSPDTELVDATYVSGRTATFNVVGEVELKLINPDGGMAVSTFTYMNSDSHPTIVMINRDGKPPMEITWNNEQVLALMVNYKGMSRISIVGTDFRENARIQVGNLLEIAPEDITYELPNKLSFIMPEMPELVAGRMYRLVIVNPDGGVASSDMPAEGLDSMYIKFTHGDSDPEITGIVPSLGPDTGGTMVTIQGRDFRDAMESYNGSLEVYFGENAVPAEDITVVSSYQVVAVSTAGDMGLKYVRVENPDGEIAIKLDGFTYISTPVITGIINANNPTAQQSIDSISIKGGERIMIKGSDFTESVRVIFNPILKEVEDDGTGDLLYCTGIVDNGGTQSSISIPYTLEEGYEGSDIQVVDSETILVTTPIGQIGPARVMVINHDGGCSSEYDDISYDWPQMDVPAGVVAEIVHDYENKRDRYIKVYWDEVEGASVYDIYVIISGDEEYLGSTELTAYLFEDIEPRTKYKFVITAIADYGSSQYSEESNVVTTGSKTGSPDNDGGLVEKTVIQQSGSTLKILVGEYDHGRDIRIDLQDEKYVGVQKVELSIPAKVINYGNCGFIELFAYDYQMTFKPDVFRTPEIMKDHYRVDCGVRFTVQTDNGRFAAAGNVVSPVYEIKTDYYRESTVNPINNLYSSLMYSMDFDAGKVAMRRYTCVELGYYDDYRNEWVMLDNGMWFGDEHMYFINQAGKYALIGSRR